MERTIDEAFFPCPICGRKPYIEEYRLLGVDTWCEGGLFNKHPIIRATVSWREHDEMYATMADFWNKVSHYSEIRALPIETYYGE